MSTVLQHWVTTNAITQETMDAALAQHTGSEAETELVKRGIVSDDLFALTLAKLYGYDLLPGASVEPDGDHPVHFDRVGALAREHTAFPIRMTNRRLVLAAFDPRDVKIGDDFTEATGLNVQVQVAPRTSILDAINRYYRADTELSELEGEIAVTATGHMGSVAEDLNSTDDEAPVVRFVNLLISQAISDRASDVHVEPLESILRVRYRIDGVMHEAQTGSIALRDGVISRLKVMSGLDIAERRKPQDGRVTVTLHGKAIDLRVATLPTVWGENVILRILDGSNSGTSLDSLNMSPYNLELFTQASSAPHGMVLVTGPTGSGKSTTLYTALTHVASDEVKVITVEDPVEQRIAGVNQVQVNPKAGLTFATALRSILRADPDILLVGEIRDGETATISVESALTGHLVFSTLHTNDAVSSIARLTEMGVEGYLVSSALKLVVSQRLVRRLCNSCKRPAGSDLQAIQALGLHDPGQAQLFGPAGCRECSMTGYRGRIPIHEVMSVNEEIQHLIGTGAPQSEMKRAASANGLVPLRADGWSKVIAGHTSLEEIIRTTR